MKEEKYIESLFEKAREEKPNTSFEEVSEKFTASLNSEMSSSQKAWAFNKLFFIPLLLLILGGIAIAIYSNLPSNEKQVSIAPPLQEKSVLPIEELKLEESITSVAKTDETQNAMPSENSTTKEVKTKFKTNDVHSQIIRKRNENSVVHQMQVSKSSKQVMKENTRKDALGESNVEEEASTAQKSDKKENSKAPVEKVTQAIRNQSELELILEAALNTELLKEELFVKNTAGEFHQLVMQTNRKFDDLIDIYFEGKKVIVIATRYSGSFNIIGGEFIDVQHLMVSEDAASLAFIYNSIAVKIDLIKTDDGWQTKSSSKDHQHEDHAEREELLQLVLDHKVMKEVIHEEKNGKIQPLSVLANGHFSNMLEVNFEGKNLEIIPYKYNRAYDRNTSYVEVTKFQIKRKKAILKFSYNKNTFEVNYRMKDGNWSIRSFEKS